MLKTLELEKDLAQSVVALGKIGLLPRFSGKYLIEGQLKRGAMRRDKSCFIYLICQPNEGTRRVVALSDPVHVDKLQRAGHIYHNQRRRSKHVVSRRVGRVQVGR
jgi:hypothetical protein